MSARFEELDWQRTPYGDISLRRRLEPVTGREVHEVRLDEEYLMSSLFTDGEVELARLALARLRGPGPVSVVVGGLGLGYTAATVLDDPRVQELVVVDALPQVIGWHRAGLVPLGHRIAEDPRCRLVQGDFFATVASGAPFGPPDDDTEAAAGTGATPGPRAVDAVVLDIDHSPRHVLSERNAAFYTHDGLTALARYVRPGGVFALWSDDPPDEEFVATLAGVMSDVAAEVVEFPNPLTRGVSTNTVYLATARS